MLYSLNFTFHFLSKHREKSPLNFCRWKCSPQHCSVLLIHRTTQHGKCNTTAGHQPVSVWLGGESAKLRESSAPPAHALPLWLAGLKERRAAAVSSSLSQTCCLQGTDDDRLFIRQLLGVAQYVPFYLLFCSFPTTQIDYKTIKRDKRFPDLWDFLPKSSEPLVCKTQRYLLMLLSSMLFWCLLSRLQRDSSWLTSLTCSYLVLCHQTAH